MSLSLQQEAIGALVYVQLVVVLLLVKVRLVSIQPARVHLV